MEALLALWPLSIGLRWIFINGTINISSVSLNPRPRASNKKDARVIKGYTKSRPTL